MMYDHRTRLGQFQETAICHSFNLVISRIFWRILKRRDKDDKDEQSLFEILATQLSRNGNQIFFRD